MPLVLGPNTITVVAQGADGGTTLVRRTVVSTNLGVEVGTVADPAGDDNGPGSYLYPTNGAFSDGAFDVRGLGVYEDSEHVNLAVTLDGDVTNPWGGNQMSVQRFDIYLRPEGPSGWAAVPARTGTNADLAAPYAFVITADGFSGMAVRDASGTEVGPATLTAHPREQAVRRVACRARSSPASTSPRRGYALTMMSHASDDEGAGGIRPVYDPDYWAATDGTDLSWIHEYRFGGGAGEWTGDTAAKDTDTSDPNVLDIVVTGRLRPGERARLDRREPGRAPVRRTRLGSGSRRSSGGFTLLCRARRRRTRRITSAPHRSSLLSGPPGTGGEETAMKTSVPASAIGLVEGSKAKAVKPVQEYLQTFGYLEGEASTFEVDDVFLRRGVADHVLEQPRSAQDGVLDDATVDAIREFQRFARLEPTGVPDAATVEKMNLHRCGNPDTVPMASTALVADFVTGVGTWASTNLTYSFQNYTADIDSTTIQWAIDQAFGLWSAETPLRFRRVSDGTSGDIVIRFVTGDHGDGNPFDGPSGILAHAFFPSNSGSIRGDTHFDDVETWTVAIPPGGGFDLVTVAAHEFGHALGLQHSGVAGAIMQPFYGGPRRFLGTDDIQGIQSLYGGPGALENATWIHGNAALVELPANVESQRYFGFFNRVVGKAGTSNWIHFALPTPVIEDGVRLTLDRFLLRCVMGESTTLRDVHIRDGERVVALHNGVNLTGTQSFARFGVASMPSVQWGVSVSLGFDVGRGTEAARRVDLISAGVDYKR